MYCNTVNIRSLLTTFYLFLPVVVCIEHDFKGFDDSILFAINWPGPEEAIDKIIEVPEKDLKHTAPEVMNVLTSNKESYSCHIPEVTVNEPDKTAEYVGPSPIELLKPLFTQKICSYRLESYWSYEVCHGRYVRQYHEEREGKQIKSQEYYLGNWSADKQKSLETIANTKPEKPKQVKVNGVALPSVEMVMDDGTLCDLNGKPRITRVQYVCYSQGRHEVYSFKETSTCEYEVIILSPLPCEHPEFKPKYTTENTINCFSNGDAPKKPRSWLAMEAETLKLQHQTVKMGNSDKDAKDVLAVMKVEKIEQDGETRLKLELHPLSEDTWASLVKDKPKEIESTPSPMKIIDDSPVWAFLKGENCLNGGTGWWKYEFCYSQYVSQYHVDRAGEKTTVKLGRFDKEAHINWIKDNKSKAPKPIAQRTSISHFYSDGDVCDKTGKPRQTEVKLKCVENSSTSAPVSLYLLEPRTCHYILGVESPLICDILPYADENGLINLSKSFEMKDRSNDEVNEEMDEIYKKVIDSLGND